MNTDKKKSDDSKMAAWPVGQTDTEDRGIGQGEQGTQKGRQVGHHTGKEGWKSNLKQNQNEPGPGQKHQHETGNLPPPTPKKRN